jgi:hypothetical protein
MKKLILAAIAVSFMLGLGFAQTAPKVPDNDIIQPSAVAARLADNKQPKPLILHVGFETLYKSNHIPSSEYAGPASTPAGMEVLKKALANIPKDREIILYCGCCPWDHCPNIRPAIEAVHNLGYKNVKAMIIEQNLDVDWIKKGYPVVTLGSGGAQ